jgi:hypothetical protein
MKVEDVPDEWRQVARMAFTKAFASTDGTCALDAALAAVIPAIQNAALERAAVALNEMADFEADGCAVSALRGAAVVLRALKEGT